MGPGALKNEEYRFDSFANGNVVEGKKKNHLPAMGWNSWNAFGSNNTEALTKDMADCIINLGLDKLGYKYIVLDDGCYLPKRVDGELANEPVKFPGGFRMLADYIHDKGLKFGMYNDIGTNLCAGAEVGTCGHEETDARSYVNWGVDFLKVDNCYYLWDNATFSNPENAGYVYAPRLRSVSLINDNATIKLDAVKDGCLKGAGGLVSDDNTYVYGIGTFDGTGPQQTPVGDESSELVFSISNITPGEYKLVIEYMPGAEPGIGKWLQIAVSGSDKPVYDDFLTASETLADGFCLSGGIPVTIQESQVELRLMNHRRQENTLSSYGKLLEGLNKADPGHDIIYSICEWGKTQPQNWGYKVGDSWRILNDITFAVGNDGDPGKGDWVSDYTNSVMSQYNKAVIMGDFAGLDKGWNDPDMLMIGMNGLTMTQYRTHMVMWCMLNSPLMLGLDLRRVKKGDELYNIIANQDYIMLNQDPLGMQARRVKVYSDETVGNPVTDYIRNNDRVDVLVKELADGSLAVSFINTSDKVKDAGYSLDMPELKDVSGYAFNIAGFTEACEFTVMDLWSKEITVQKEAVITVGRIEPFDNITVKITPGRVC